MSRAKNKRGKAGRVAHAKTQLQPKVIVCSVCGKGDGKYKCPQCRAPFCCVRCAKEHKAQHCAAVQTAAAAPADDGAALPRAPSRYLPQRDLDAAPRRRLPRATGGDASDSQDDEPGWNVTPEMRARLRGAAWLRRELEDGGLRQLIGRIDAASEGEEEAPEEGARRGARNGRGRDRPSGVTARELALARTRRSHPKFASFVDRLMLAAGVLQPAEGGAGDGRDLESTLAGGGESGPLVLTPAPTPGARSETDGSASDSDSSSDGDESSDSDDSESSDDGEESGSDGSTT